VLAHAWIPIPEVAKSLASVVTAQPASSSPTSSLASEVSNAMTSNRKPIGSFVWRGVPAPQSHRVSHGRT
jgi:hypothetical protein